MIRLLALIFLLGSALSGAAHETTRSYLNVTRNGATLQADLRVAFRDLAALMWMDTNLDGALAWAEVAARQDEIAAYAIARIDLRTGGACTLRLTGTGASTSGGIGYHDLRFAGRCPDGGAPLTVATRLLEDIDPDHRLFLTVAGGGATSSAVLGRNTPAFSVPVVGLPPGRILRDHIAAGVSHLLGGPDHIAFVLLLVLPAVTGGLPLRRAALGVLAAMTAFTLAHALTLSAATLAFLQPPPDLISAMVALTVIITAADNLRPFLPGPRAAAAVVFGLIHGFGFAAVLGEGGLTGTRLAIALAGFNIGIELAQIGVLLATAFALAALRLDRFLLRAGSVAGIGVGAFWLWNAAAALSLTGL